MSTDKPLALDPEDIRVGATIAALREARGFTQEQLASRSFVSRAYLANIEAGRKKPSGRVVARVAQALGVKQIALVRPDLIEVDAA